MTATPPASPLPFEALERVYDQLAAAIDQAGDAHEALFLTKLVMVMAHRAGAGLDMEAAIATALENLGVPAQTLSPSGTPSS
ncbi:MAG: hypothetical protein Q8O26_20195 [Phreatobacter sp.]|uniref:hypothetical protein n=1 Tax=Phreatobacter sp. TaxID=1966341 RepID=UPI0027335F6A|nr:hypothetical protein [Phreatobacter sp.]MDP2804197.1 hypothetical protein [Phreatobacter sp.]